jgi:hypothetical protein
MQVQKAEKDVRSYGSEISAAQQFSPDQPFDGIITKLIQTARSLRSVSAIHVTTHFRSRKHLPNSSARAMFW